MVLLLHKKPVTLTVPNVKTQAIALFLLFVMSCTLRGTFVVHLGSIPLYITHHHECVCLWRQTTTQDSRTRNVHTMCFSDSEC